MRRSPYRARWVAALATAVALFAAAGASARPARTVVIHVRSNGVVVAGNGLFACGSCSARVRRGTVLSLRASPHRHFAFSRWSGDCVGTARTCVVLVDRPTSVRAVFVAKDRTVTLTVGGPGHVVSRPKGLDCGAGHDRCNADFPWGTKLRLVPVPAAVGRFARWGAACWNFGAGACTLTVRRELSGATAAFGHAAPAADPQHLTITLIDSGPQHVTSTPAGIDCPAVCDASFPAGTPVALRGTVSTIWSGDCQTQETSRCAVIVDAPTNVRVVAHSVFKPRPPPVSRGGGGYGVNVTVNGKGRVTAPGINCGGPKKSLHTCQGLFGTQAAVILTAKPEKHSAFLGWNQFCRAKGKNPHCRVVVLASVNVGALFQR